MARPSLLAVVGDLGTPARDHPIKDLLDHLRGSDDVARPPDRTGEVPHVDNPAARGRLAQSRELDEAPELRQCPFNVHVIRLS